MRERQAETTSVHTRLLHYALQVDDARAYWSHVGAPGESSARRAFDEYWFGARSLRRAGIVVTNMRARFDAFPGALDVLHRWIGMEPESRRVICHWHLQLADPLYRRFTADYLADRREGGRGEVTRDLVAGWVGTQEATRWNLGTRIQFASKLLSAAHSAGLVRSNRDPRVVVLPKVPDTALEYLLYLLRETEFKGTLLSNPYLASVGLVGPVLEERLRALRGLEFRRQGDLVEFGWRYDTLRGWADGRFESQNGRVAGGAP